MDFRETTGGGKHLVSGYGDGGFTVRGERVEGSIIVHADGVISLGAISLDAVDSDALIALITPLKLDLLLLGTGANMSFPAEVLREALKDAGIALEFMDTGGAARTYNVLCLEGRRVAAALVATR